MRKNKEELRRVCTSLEFMNEEARATVEQLRDGKPIDRYMVASAVESFANHLDNQIKRIRRVIN